MIIVMNLAQIPTQISSINISNNFYFKANALSHIDLKYYRLSNWKSLQDKNIIAFGLPSTNFMSAKIRNSLHESIVISAVNDSNIFADATNNWIKKYKDKNHQSLFYKEIFKALLSQKIEIIVGSQGLKNQKLPIQKYIWHKNWIPRTTLSVIKNKNSNNISKASKAFLMDQMSSSPVFVVKNGFNEIILGHPVSRIKRMGLEQVASSFLKPLQDSKLAGSISHGLFFFHPDDAIEFKDCINSTNPVSSKDMDIRVEPVGLHFAYKMNRTLLRDTRFTWIPDFKEVGDLIMKHQNDKNLIFHDKQYYGKDFFQGQPVYTIQPITIKARNGKLKIIRFRGLNDDREVLFTNREAANQSWTNFIKTMPDLKLMKKPNLLVYNLESLLQEKEQLSKEALNRFVLITNKQAYRETKELVSIHDSHSLFKQLKVKIKPKLFFIELWVRRLTSTLVDK